LWFPFTDEPMLAQVAPLELRGQLPSDPSASRIGYETVARDPSGSHVLAVVARRRDLDDLDALAATAGVALAGVTVAPLALRWLLPPGFTGTVVLADGARSSASVWQEGTPRALRALTADASDPETFADELAWSLPLLGSPTATLRVAGPSMTPVLQQALARQGLSPEAVSLAHLELDIAPQLVLGSPVVCGLAVGALDQAASVAFARAAPTVAFVTPRLRRLAVAAAVLVVLDLGLVRLDLARREAHVRDALHAAVADALPGEPIVAPRAQLEAAVAARRASGSTVQGTVLARLREVSERIPDGLAVDLQRLSLEGERLQLGGHAPTFESVDVLRRALVGSARLCDVATDEVRTTVDGTRVSFRLHARWVAPGETPS
jgi:hypothetical protein